MDPVDRKMVATDYAAATSCGSTTAMVIKRSSRGFIFPDLVVDFGGKMQTWTKT